MQTRTLIQLLLFLVVVAATSCGQRMHVLGQPAAHLRHCAKMGTPDIKLDAVHYDVALQVRSDQSIAGTVTIKVHVLRGGQVLDLDARDLQVETVRDGETATCFEQDAERLRIRLAHPASPGDNRFLTIAYQARSSRGLHLSASMAFTTFHTDSWLPCVFDPADKASFNLSLRVPPGWSAAASGESRHHVDQDAAASSRYEFLLRQPHSAYLFGFVAGTFDEHQEVAGDVKLRFLGSRRSSEQLARIFASTDAALKFFVERSGLPYSGGTYTQALVPIASGQELAGLSLLSERYADDLVRDEHEDWLVVHELSHQWWGNRVTCAEWRDFWMHEAFATFMTAAFKEVRWGGEAYEREVELARKRYRRLRSEGRDRALAPSGSPTADDVGGPLPYAKGMLVFHYLRQRLGDKIFFHAIERFTQTHAGGIATTQMLRQSFEREAEMDLSAVFDDFVFGTRPLPEPD